MTEMIESWYKKNLKKKNHVIDVGANIGLMTAYFSTRWSKVTAFEPSPKSFSCLEKNCNKENIDLHNLGLSDKEDKVLFAQCSNSEIDQIVSTNAVLKKNWKPTEIPVTYLDKFNFDSVDLLKIDVEGHEMAVLDGALKFIKKNHIKLIQIEFNWHNLLTKNTIYDYSAMLEDYVITQLNLINGKLRIINPIDPLSNLYFLSNFIFIEKSFFEKYKKNLIED
jgi:FkbM family methyltransferase